MHTCFMGVTLLVVIMLDISGKQLQMSRMAMHVVDHENSGRCCTWLQLGSLHGEKITICIIA